MNLLKKILDQKSIIVAIIVTGSLLYYTKVIFSRGNFVVDSKLMFGAFAIMVMWCLFYMILHIHRLNKTVDQLARTNEDMKTMLKTIVENQMHHEIATERLHRNTRILLLEAITESEDSDGGNKRKVMA